MGDSGRVRRAFRNKISLVGAAVLVLILASCATATMTENMEMNGEEGFISIYSTDLKIEIIPIIDGMEGPRLKNWNWWSRRKDYRIACPPGVNEILVSHKNYNERLLVDVRTGCVTFVSFRRQVSNYDVDTSYTYEGSTTTTSTSYYVRRSTGGTVFPLDSAEIGTEVLIDALGDVDWGTRNHALGLLSRRNDPIDDETMALIKRMSVEDDHLSVRKSAGKLLDRNGMTKPAPPLFLETFTFDVSSNWYLGTNESTGTAYEMAPTGYEMTVTTDRADWSYRDYEWALKDRDSTRLAMECSYLAGEDKNVYGICYGPDSDNFLLFGISGNGGAVVGLFVDGNWTETPIPWTQVAEESLRSGTGHRLEVEREGNSFAYSVNSIDIGTVTWEGQGLPDVIGMYVYGPQRVAFHKIVAY